MHDDRNSRPSRRLGACVLGLSLLLVSSPRAQLVDCDGDGILEPAELTVEFRIRGITWGSWALPSGLSTGDVNGDRWPDAIWSLTLASSSALSWQANDGAGNFGPAQTIHAGQSRSPQARDLDGDGDADVAATVFALGLSWFENLDGQGAFGPARILDPDLGGYSIGDVDGDGDLDFLRWKEDAGGGLFVMANLGGGVFTPPELLLTIDDVATIVIDLDRDQAPDLVYYRNGGSLQGLHWRRNLGGGVYDAPVTVTTDSSIYGVIAVDLDRDGDLDLAYSRNAAEALRWHENTDGQGGFGPPRVVDSTLPGLLGLAAADFDGDGDPDLLAANEIGESFWWENLGGATFGERRLAADPPLVQGNGAGIGVADIDMDGVQDFVVIASVVDDYTPYYSYWYGWYENERDDCNADGVPDKCEIDCNENGRADTCDLATGLAKDCDGSESPDVCDAGCTTCDIDGDGCLDEVDADPVNPTVCGDSDIDGCEDCSAGGFDPRDDGPDADGDGRCWLGDCTDDNGAAWAEPGAARSLTLTESDLETLLEWDATNDPGGITVNYDLLRSWAASDFHAGTACVEAGSFDTSAQDDYEPGSDELVCYLVRVDNHCPGDGAMGTDSAGQPRSGMICP